MKKTLPNMLSLMRIILTPFIMLFTVLKLYTITLILAIIAAITDFLDGKLARLWKTTSLKGAKIDALADKVFAIGLLLTLLFIDHSIIIILVLEIIIGCLNLYYHKKTDKTESLMIGKFKANFLFITIIISYFNLVNPKLNFLYNGFKYATINLQFLCLICYYKKYYQRTHDNADDLDKTKVIDNLNDITRYEKNKDSYK